MAGSEFPDWLSLEFGNHADSAPIANNAILQHIRTMTTPTGVFGEPPMWQLLNDRLQFAINEFGNQNLHNNDLMRAVAWLLTPPLATQGTAYQTSAENWHTDLNGGLPLTIPEHITAAQVAINQQTIQAEANINSHTTVAQQTVQADLTTRSDEIKAEVLLRTAQNVQVLSGHHDYDPEAPELPTWSIPADIQVQINAAETNIGTIISNLQDFLLDHINGSRDDLQVFITAARDAINAHTTGQANTILTRIGTAETNVTNRVAQAETSINGNVDSEGTSTRERVAQAETNVNTQVTNTQEFLTDQLLGVREDVQQAIVTSEQIINAHTSSDTANVQTVLTNRIAQAEQTVNAATVTALQPLTETDEELQAQGFSIGSILLAILSGLAFLGNILDAINGFHFLFGGGWPKGNSPELLSEQQWNTSIRWLQPADFYEIQIDGHGSHIARMDFPGPDWIPRIGWACLISSFGYGDRRFIEFAHRRIDVHESEATGLLIFCKPGTFGVVRAYRYS